MPRTPNVLFIMTDQHRTDTLGCYGNPHVRTPALDALAARGTVFGSCSTPTAICSPARASLLTGVMPFRHRLLANYERNVGYIEELSDEFTPFSQRLRKAGYNVGLTGKWHVGRRRGPDDFGFDGTHFPGWHNPVYHPRYAAWLAERGLAVPEMRDPVRSVFPNGQPGNLLAGRLDVPADATFEAFLADETISWLRGYAADYAERGTPFFMATHFWTFDSLSLGTWRWLIAAYWGYVTLIDGQVGRMLAALETLGLADSTCVVFTADHGEFTGSHRLHDKGPAMYDDIYRIPAILNVPGAAPRREERFASLLDFSATILDIAGLDPDQEADGSSLLPLARGEDPPRRRDAVLAEFHGHHFPYPQRMIRTNRAKLVVNPESLNELYDLERDPDELSNVYDDPAYRETRDALLHRLYTELRDRGDNFHHWMTTMYPVGGKDYDTSLSDFEGTRHQEI